MAANILARGGGAYLFTVSLGKGPNGTYLRKWKTVHADESLPPKKLRDYLDYEYSKFKAEVENGTHFTPGKKTFEEFIPMWRENYARSNLSPTTLNSYEDHIASRLIPSFGYLRLEQIKTTHILDFLKALEKPGTRRNVNNTEPLDFGTIGYIYRVLKNIFSRAVEWNMIPTNPMSGISKPTPDIELKKQKLAKQKSNPQYYNEDEAQAVVDALYKESRKWRMLILGSLIGGFRRGELVGLERHFVNFDENSITIENNIPLSHHGVAVEKDPKSLSSIRTVDMPDWYMDELQLFFQEWDLEKEDLGTKWQGENREFVFHNGTGKPYYYQHPSKWWIRFCNRHKLRYIKFHGLRHSTGTLLIEDEEDSNVDALLIAIQHRLGHSRLSTTSDTYIHVTKKVKKRTTGKFDKFARPNNTAADNEIKETAPPLLKRVK